MLNAQWADFCGLEFGKFHQTWHFCKPKESLAGHKGSAFAEIWRLHCQIFEIQLKMQNIAIGKITKTVNKISS